MRTPTVATFLGLGVLGVAAACGSSGSKANSGLDAGQDVEGGHVSAR